MKFIQHFKLLWLRYKDLERCFMRILEEEEEEDGGSAARDKKVVEQICREVEAFESLR